MYAIFFTGHKYEIKSLIFLQIIRFVQNKRNPSQIVKNCCALLYTFNINLQIVYKKALSVLFCFFLLILLFIFQGDNLNLVVDKFGINVTVGIQECSVINVTMTELTCSPPPNKPPTGRPEVTVPEVNVRLYHFTTHHL